MAGYNDLASVRASFEANPGDVAAVIVEPVSGNMGVVAPDRGFLEGLRAPMLPDTGSTMTAATSPGFASKDARTDARSV